MLAISEFGGNCDILVMKVFLDLKLINDSIVFQVDSSHEIRATFAPSAIRSVVIFFIILFTKTSEQIEFQTNFGTKCAKCNLFVEGEVVSALGNTFHQVISSNFQNLFLLSTSYFKKACFTCARCKRPFPTGERVTFTGKNCLCQACIQVGENKKRRASRYSINWSPQNCWHISFEFIFMSSPPKP